MGLHAKRDYKPDMYSRRLHDALHDNIYMYTQKPPHDYSQQLYDKYRKSFEEYITTTVLPSLSEKHDELMLSELVKRWFNHKIMVRWLTRFFHYLDRYFILIRPTPSPNQCHVTALVSDTSQLSYLIMFGDLAHSSQLLS